MIKNLVLSLYLLLGVNLNAQLYDSELSLHIKDSISINPFDLIKLHYEITTKDSSNLLIINSSCSYLGIIEFWDTKQSNWVAFDQYPEYIQSDEVFGKYGFSKIDTIASNKSKSNEIYFFPVKNQQFLLADKDSIKLRIKIWLCSDKRSSYLESYFRNVNIAKISFSDSLAYVFIQNNFKQNSTFFLPRGFENFSIKYYEDDTFQYKSIVFKEKLAYFIQTFPNSTFTPFLKLYFAFQNIYWSNNKDKDFDKLIVETKKTYEELKKSKNEEIIKYNFLLNMKIQQKDNLHYDFFKSTKNSSSDDPFFEESEKN
jgi:hypothetical protein